MAAFLFSSLFPQKTSLAEVSISTIFRHQIVSCFLSIPDYK